jgi:hypothetical protein
MMPDTQDGAPPPTQPNGAPPPAQPEAQDVSPPPAAADGAPRPDPQPAAAPRPSSTFGSLSSRHIGATWQIVAALAVLVGLLTGIVTLFDRFTAAPPPVVTPAPTTPSIRTDISSAAGATELVDFAEAQAGKLVDLDLSCFETVASPACILEPSGPEVAVEGDDSLLLWLFTQAPCFAPQLVQPIETRDLESCLGTNVIWVDPDTEGSPVVLSNIQGAGTIAMKGPWELADLGGGGVFPGNIHAFRLTPHVTRPLAADTPPPN